ncbi:MAG: hypothetical protein GWO24_28250 [Akkermansiaceae bacterium]|nr:hypothetical protein [Akkermansiaceae bacterium]NIS13524.1 hypothetical protein [Thermoplasmata archaeon]NIT78946.1 hypothetical protein [Thermoplasmata archaeon]NIY05314.1 hypothetical protein [Thermoplasmata archaeon]
MFDRVINYLDAGIVLFKGQGVATESLIEIYRSIRDDVRKEASRMEAERQGGEAARAGGEEEE